MRKFLLFLSVMFVGLLYAKADTTTITFSELGYANADDITTVDTKDSYLTVVCDKGTSNNPPKYYTTGTGLRMYGGNIMTISVPDGFMIKEVVFTASAANFVVKGDPKDESGAVNGTLTTSGSTSTWSGESAKIVLNSTATCRCQKMSVTYEYVAQTAVDPVDISCEIEGADGIVTLTCPTEGSTIYYGYSEDKMTNVYSAPFKVTENCTVYAYAEKDGEKSITKNYDVVLPYTSFKKVIENTSGADQITIVGDFQVIYVNGDKRRLILTDGTSNLLIYRQNNEYSIDYAVGTKISKIEGSVASYNECFRLIDADLTEGGNGCSYSPVELTSLSGLSYEDNIFDEVVIKNCIISGKDSGSPVIELGDESIALYDLFNIGYENGVGADITGFVWRFKDVLEIVPIEIKGGEAVATVERPTFTPADRELKLNDVVTIKCATEGATIYYTLDGTDPDNSSSKYTAPIPFTESCTIKARAYYEGEDKTMLPSPVASREYHVFDPTINVISEGNHDADEKNTVNSYIKHDCTVDGVEYHMNAAHVGDGGTNGTNNTLMMNNGNKNAKFCYLIQVGENPGYVLDGIEVAYNTNNNNVNFAVRAANTPFDDSDSNMSNVKTAITNHGVAVGTITESSPALSSEDFAKDYKYFAIYPSVDKAVYLDSFTIHYREAGPLTAPKLLGLEDLDEDNIYFDEDEGDYLVMATEPLMLDFDIDLEDNPDVEIYYILSANGIGQMNTLALSDDDDDPDVPYKKYDGSSIEVNTSGSLMYWAQKGEEMSEPVVYNFMIMIPFEIPAIKGLEDAEVEGDAEKGFIVESDEALSLTFDYDVDLDFNTTVTYRITYENGDVANGKYDGTPIVIEKSCEMIIIGRNGKGESAQVEYTFIINSESATLPAPKIKEGSFRVENGYLMADEEQEIEFETVDGIHIYYSVVERNVPAKAASACENDHNGFNKHEGETVKLNGNHASFSFFACNPETGEHSDTVSYLLDVATGILSIEADDDNALYFNLQGVRIAKPENGTYIRVQNGKSVKRVK